MLSVPSLYHSSLIRHPFLWVSNFKNRIRGVLVSMLQSSAIDRGFMPQLGQFKDYKIGI
jgi:hypothetical protein